MERPSYYNSEGYPDPTNYYALLHMMEAEKAKKAWIYAFRPIIYICSPFAGDTKQNIKNARKYCRFAVKKGYLPIAPHLLFPQFLDDTNADERELGLFMGNVLMTKCVEVWVFGDRISEGMQKEIDRAKRKNYRLRYFTTDLLEVRDK